MTQVNLRVRSETASRVNRIRELSGENLRLCMQCATCSAVCPMAESMGATPRQVMHLLQFGLTDAALEARAAELCAACHTCTVRCPRGIDVARVFEAVRLLRLRDNVDLLRPAEIDQDTRRRAPQIAFVSAFRKLTA